MLKKIFLILASTAVLLGINSCSTHKQQNVVYNTTRYRSDIWAGSPQEVWTDVQQLSSKKLFALQKSNINNQDKLGWIKLALIAKTNSNSTNNLVRQILAWREQYPTHPGNKVLPDNRTLNLLLNQHLPQNIAVLLPQTGRYASAARSVRQGILNAYYDNTDKSSQRIKFYDTNTTPPAIAYQQAITNGADFVIGPLTKDQVDAVRKTSIKRTMLALNYTKPGYFGLPENFYEFGLKPEDEATQVAKRARRNGLSRAIVIAPDNKWGKRLTAAFLSTWKSAGGSITDSLYYNKNIQFTDAIPKLLKIDVAADKKLTREEKNKYVLTKQRRHDFDVIFLFAKPAEARDIVPLLRYYYIGEVPIYATSAVHDSNQNASRNVDLGGVIVCDIPANSRGGRINNGAPSKRLYAVGRDAYTISQNLERLAVMPSFPVYGSTGALVMSPSQQIYRRIPCTPVRNIT